MRRIVIALASTVTGLVLLFSWPTSLNRTATATAGATEGSTAPQEGTPAAEEPADPAREDTASEETASEETAEPTEAATASSRTYTGAAVGTRYGDVVVQITVTDGVLSDVAAIEYPYTDHHDQRINDVAIPVLDAAALAAGSADIAMVSGATVTSEAYVQSLQDALDQAAL